VFSSDFTEGSATDPTSQSEQTTLSRRPPSIIESDILMITEFEDSDNEDDRNSVDGDSPPSPTLSHSNNSESALLSSTHSFVVPEALTTSTIPPGDIPMDEDTGNNMGKPSEGSEENEATERNVRTKRVHPSSPRSSPSPSQEHKISGTPKTTVVVKDFAYSTYYAVLYYVRHHFFPLFLFIDSISKIYTNTITFAPLSSSFIPSTRSASGAQNISDQTAAVSGDAAGGGGNGAPGKKPITNAKAIPSSRKEWIQEFKSNNPSRPAPCSAKAVYRLADRAFFDAISISQYD
jgi:hypothetical protein